MIHPKFNPPLNSQQGLLIDACELLRSSQGSFFMTPFMVDSREAMTQDQRNRNILSGTGMAVNWGNTSPNPRGGVSSFRFLEEEKEQSSVFYLCGPPARLSSPLSVSAPLSLLIYLIHRSQMRLVLCSGTVCLCT